MTTQQIESYLKERTGYLKKGAASLALIMQDQGYDVSESQCAEALSKVRKEFKGVQATQTISYTLGEDMQMASAPVDLSSFQPVKVWGKEGNWSASYELKQGDDVEEVKKIVAGIKDQLRDYADSRPDSLSPKVDGLGKAMVTLTDLHIGALVGALTTNTPEFSINHVIDYLNDAAERINRKGYREVRVSILGDIIESFTGTNHPSTWKELEHNGYGANVIIIAYEILRTFLSKVNNLSEVYIVGGNHDRVTKHNAEDYEYGAAKMISYFLDQHSDYNVIYDNMILTVSMDGIDYIMSHGHLPMIKKNPEFFILNYGKNKDNFSMLLSGHLHARQKTEQVTNKATVIADAAKYRVYSCPSIFTGNFFSESLGFSSSPGFMIFESYNGKPEVLDITL